MKPNPSLQFLFVLIVAIEISFTTNLVGNCIIIAIGLIYLIIEHTHLERLFWILVIAFIPAAGLLLSQTYYANNLDSGFLLFSRIYAYVIIGADFTFTTRLYDLTNSLEQNLHLSTKFVYGIMAAVNLIPAINAEVKKIRTASAMRGVQLHLWSPTLYFKAILSSLRWAGNLAQGMESHGFTEGQSRTFHQRVRITGWDWLLLACEIIILQLILFLT